MFTSIPPTAQTNRRKAGYTQDVSWRAATASDNSIFVAGQVDGELRLVRCSWQSVDLPGKTWMIEPRFSESPILLATNPHADDFVLVHLVEGPLLRTQHEFQPSNENPMVTSAGPIQGMSSFVIAAARTTHGMTWLLELRRGCLTLVAIGPRGEQISTEMVPIPTSPGFEVRRRVLPVPFHARADRIYIGVTNKLLALGKTVDSTTTEFSQQITSVVGSAPNTRTRIAVTFERGGEIYWDDLDGGVSESFGPDMHAPIACFNRGGYLTVACEDSCEVFSTQNERLQRKFVLPDLDSPPIAILSPPQANQFAIVSKSGVISVYELS